MSKRSRRYFTTDENVALLECVMHTWQRQLFENASVVFEAPQTSKSSRARELEARIAQLEARLAKRTRSLPIFLANTSIQKSHWGTLSDQWVPHDTRDEIVDFVCVWAEKTELPRERFMRRIGVAGYRRLTFMMLDHNVVAVSPATVYRVLSNAGRLGSREETPVAKGMGFSQPLDRHEHCHINIAYLNDVLEGALR